MPAFPVMQLGELYFYTASILHWQKLLKPDKYKQVVLDSLRYLSQRDKIRVYGLVIMPNHIHLVWELLEKNGKELPHASFMKFTAHAFLKDLREHHPQVLPYFCVRPELGDDIGKSSVGRQTTAAGAKPVRFDRRYQFWQRNSLPVGLFSRNVLEQKLAYIHANPVSGKWDLAENYVAYPYSSAQFYEEDGNDFGFLRHYKDRF